MTDSISPEQNAHYYETLYEQVKASSAALALSQRLYERLVLATKGFIFTVLVQDGRPTKTIHYPGVYQVTGYTEAEYGSEPLLWYRMIHMEDKELVLHQVEQVLRGETPAPIEHRIWHKDGSLRWLKNTSIPEYDEKGGLVAYDGLIVDITDLKNKEAELIRNIDELKKALSLVKTLQALLPICAACKKIRTDTGEWSQIEEYMYEHSNITFTHGLCPSCAARLYPNWYNEKDQA